jgi:hypothetical protein
VEKLAHGGWEMELDVVAFNPQINQILHIEPSLDANSWDKREARFTKKFEAGRKYIANRQRIANSRGCFVRHGSAALSVCGNRQQPCG